MRGARSGSVKPTGDGRRSYIPGSLATGRPNGKPHEHAREIARRLRQAERDKATRRVRALARGAPRNLKREVGVSRRGRRVVSA